MVDKIKLDVPVFTILKIIFVLFLLYIVYAVRDILVLLFIVFILVAALRPTVKKWEKSIGKPLSVLILFVITVLIIAGFISIVVPPLIEQTRALIDYIPEGTSRFVALKAKFPSIERGITNIAQNLGNMSGNFISITTSIFGGIVSFFTVIILTFYILLDERFFSSFLLTMSSEKRNDLLSVGQKITQKIGSWLNGQLLLGLAVGLIVFIGLSIIGLPYALTLGVVAGVLEFIPVIGPIISGVVAALIALTISPITAIIVVIFYIIVQQLENNLLVPKIMQKAVGLPPAIIIIAILLGSKLLGVIGALLAVPISGVIYVVAQEWETIKTIGRK